MPGRDTEPTDGQRMKTHLARLSLALLLLLLGVPAAAQEEVSWDQYLDYAFVFSSADQPALKARLDQYGREVGIPLEKHIAQRLMPLASQNGPEPDERIRRRAIAHLLIYLAEGKNDELEEATEAANGLKPYLGRTENQYWHHYVLAHDSLERGRPYDFVGHVLDLWLTAVVPLETPYETLKALSLSESPNSGFASSLPFLYENVARLVLIRSQQMGIDRGLDPLGAVVRLLADRRVGAHPDVIPLAASSKDYLDRIVERLEGPESDAGSLTFTLALFEATKLHDTARGLLATEGLSTETVKAIRVAGAAYRTAENRADTVSGEAAVQTRVLRQLGEIYAAKQRLKVDPEIETPFTIEDAILVYTKLADAEADNSWSELGFTTRDGYIATTRGLWEDIQEATLNAADYYLSRSVEFPHLSDEYSRNAARLYSRYLTLFQKYALTENAAGVPDSAYFAAHEAARGVGDAFLLYASHPTPEEVDLGIRRYRSAMRIFPFDRTLWSALTAALEKQGRESEFMALVRPAAEAATRSRVVNRWIQAGEPEAARLTALQRAFSDSLAVMYLGFAEANGVSELKKGLDQLRAQKAATEEKVRKLRRKLGSKADAVPASMDDDAPRGMSNLDAAEVAEAQRELAEASAMLEQLDQQIEARARTIPVYVATLETDGMGAEMRARRDHPLHGLLRRMYHEDRSSEQVSD
jgi:hypothetical protein